VFVDTSADAVHESASIKGKDVKPEYALPKGTHKAHEANTVSNLSMDV
jgi:hypothetical protein